MAFILSAQPLSLENLEKIFREKPLLEISPELLEKIGGYNAGIISSDNATTEAFLAAHALGFGSAVPEPVTRLALVLQLYTLLLPVNQPFQPESLYRILAFYNREVWPIVYEQALPVSQLTQLCLPLLGKGKVSFQGYELNAADVMDIFSWTPLSISAQEVDKFINQNTFNYAYLLYHIFQLQPQLKWLEYLMQVFDQISSEQTESLPQEWKKLADAVINTSQYLQHNYSLPFEKQDLAQVRNSVLDLLQLLTKVMAAVTDLASETFENLLSTSEPPSTTSFSLAGDLVLSLQKQIKLTAVNSTDTIILNKDMRIIHHEFADALRLTEQVIALALWSVTQVGKVFTLTAGNLTLSAYYHSAFFVPNEMVLVQLEKIISFTRITTPAPLT